MGLELELAGSRQRLIENFIRRSKVLSFREVVRKLECSEITVRRDLKLIDAITSYTHRGQFITLPSIAVFNEHGIWFYDRIGFTKFKNSLELIVNIIEQSELGVSKEDLEEILGIKISKQIQILLRQDKLHRVKLGNTYRYLPKKLASNKGLRLKALGVNTTEEEYYEDKIKISDLVATLKVILLEYEIDVKNLKLLVRKYSLELPLKRI